MKRKKVIAAGLLAALLLAGCGQENAAAGENTEATEEDATQTPNGKPGQEDLAEPAESPGGGAAAAWSLHQAGEPAPVYRPGLPRGGPGRGGGAHGGPAGWV